VTRIAPILAVLAAVQPAPSTAKTLAFAGPAAPARCDILDLSADQMACDDSTCELRGNVHLICERLALWADELDIILGPDHGFAGAVARGNVLMAEGNTLLECRRLTLAEDRVAGRVDAAAFHIKRPPMRRDRRGIPIGRDESVFTGDVERQDEKRLRVTDATFTMCDCGDEPPSWVLDATTIDATLGERATLWWPRLRFNVPWVGPIPGPPLLPISLALADRATGMLPPEVKFLGAWPTVDLPLFIPLGDSFDITLSPGMRFDWGTAPSPVSRWGAPRLGARVRYAPSAGTSGEIRVSWTGDLKRVGARRFAETSKELIPHLDKLEEHIEDNPNSGTVAALLARRDLVHRVDVEIDHRTDFSDSLTWLVAAEWLSDDLIADDFRIGLDDRFANYVPSRTQLLWRMPGLSAVAAADHLLALGNSWVGGTPPEFDYSNVDGREAGIAHRGPHVQLSLLPWRLAEGLHLEADLSWVRYGAWTDARPPDLVMAGGRTGVAYLNRLGPVRLQAGAYLDALWLESAGAEPDAHIMAAVDAAASIRLAKAWDTTAHVVEPRLVYRALPWESSAPSGPPVDPRLDRAQLHQLAVELDQSLWRTDKASRRLARLVLSQPIDLATGDLLHTRVHLDAGGGGVKVSAWADIDLPARFSTEEVGTQVHARWGPLSAAGEWARWSPRADRFRRTLYELGAADPEKSDQAQLSDKAWVHMLRATAGLDLGSIRASYAADYLLPIEEVDCETPDQPDECMGERVPGFTRHEVSISYRSPCDCWGVTATLSIPAADPSLMRAGVSFDIGGYSVGN
jgi:hypothetical protein